LRTLNLGILAHVDAGKTTLSERLLFEAGVLDEPGSVDAGSTRTDTMSLERRRGITIRAAVVSFEVDGVLVNLFDTPGHSDFIAEVERSLSLLDGAVLVVSAVEGVQAQTLVLMRALQRLGIATVVFINKSDRTGADVDFVTVEVHERLSADVPVLCGSAITGAGVRELMMSLVDLLPVREPAAAGCAAGSVFKIDRDAAGSKSVYAHLRSGTLRVRDRLDLGRGPAAKVTGLRAFSDGELVGVREAYAGQVVELRGVESARIGDTFGEGRPGAAAGQFARPSLATVVEPVNEADRGRLHGALTQLAEQDPLIDLRQDGARRELQLSLYGEVQKEVIGALLAEEYGIEATFRESTVICIERVLGTGHAVEVINTPSNPFLATVGLCVEPADVGAGVRFDLQVELGSMPPAFFTAVETAVRSTLQQGRLGWEVRDCRVVMTHAGYWARQSHSHGTFDKSMSSTAGDFRNLTRLVLGTALNEAGTVVCEPIHRFDLEVAEDTLSGVLALLATVGAVPVTTHPRPPVVTLTGDVPAGAVHALLLALPGVSRGEGVLTTAPNRFRPVTGPPPRRERSDHNPYDRDEYLRRVTRSTTT
jgi:ribosomal protection tetracycline resistance protein